MGCMSAKYSFCIGSRYGFSKGADTIPPHKLRSSSRCFIFAQFSRGGGRGPKSLNTYVPKQTKSRCAHTVFKNTLNCVIIILEIWLEVEIILMKMVKRDGQSWRSYMRIP